MLVKKSVLFFILGFFFWSCEKDRVKETFVEAQNLKYKTDEKSLREAIEKYEKTFLYALESLNGKYDALKSLGILLAYEKKYLEAREVLLRAKKLKEDDVDIYYHLGFSYLNLAKRTSDRKKKEEWGNLAKNELEKGLLLDPKNDSLTYGLGILQGFIFDNNNLALEYLGQAYEYNPKNINIIFALANISYKNGNQVAAKNYYEEIIKKFPEKTESIERAKENLKKINSVISIQ